MTVRAIKLALIGGLLLLACGDRAREPSPPPAPGAAARPEPAAPRRTAPADAPNLVLIVLDTVRRDHLSTYGYARPTSPELSRIAERGARFARASSNAPWTHPAHASMLTGVYSSEHGARYAGAAADPRHAILQLDARAPRLLQQLLADAGYHPIASVGAPILAPGLGVVAGFATFSGARPDQEPPATEVNERLLAALDHRPAGAPVFLLVNYYDAHAPYVARPAGAPWIDPASMTRQVDVTRAVDGLPRFARLAAGHETLSPEIARAAVDNYDSEIALVDTALGALVAALEQRGLLENAVVAITADHGEYFGEHGLWEHGRTLHRELTDVPLVVLGPGVPAGRSIETPVQTLDLFPTFLEAAGLPVPDSCRGSSLWPLLRGAEAGWRPHPIAAEAFADPAVAPAAPTYARDYRSLDQGDQRLIVGEPGGHAALYDLATDPGEQRDLSASAEARVAKLAQTLDAWLPRATGDGVGAALSPERRAQLERLGYLRPEPAPP